MPEYGLTRADERLLRRHADEIVDRVAGPVAVAELGSGSGKKTRWLLEAFCRRQRTSYYPIEISHSALVMCERELRDIDAISIVGFEREYLDGLLEVAAYRKSGQHLFVLFLGSTIGNFDRPAGMKFLAEVRRILEPGDSLLLGTDLEKPSSQLLPAYDDELGVTAAFNLNLLARIESRTRRRLRFASVRACGEDQPRSAQCRDALTIEAAAGREYSGGGSRRRVSRRRNYLDGKQPQVFGRRDSRDGTGCRFPLRSAMDR